MARARETFDSIAPWFALLALSFAFRAPALLNAAATNSDAAIVGLQAMHIGAGERPLFLLGSGYQTASDSYVAAAFFGALGPTALALMLSALCLHVLSTLLAYATLRRHMSAWGAFVPALALVFTTSCLHSFALYPPRQLALTLAMLALWLLDEADRPGRFFLGCALTTLAWASDPYAMVFVAPLALLAALHAHKAMFRREAFGACAAGLVAGAIPIAVLWFHPSARHGVTDAGLDVVGHNARLLFTECLPWMSGASIYAPVHWMDYARIDLGPVASALQLVGVTFGMLAMGYGAFAVMAGNELTALRRLAGVAFATMGVTVAGFLVSHMVMDHFSMRYLAGVALVLPFAFAPLVNRLGPLRGAALLSPYLLTAAVGGWLGYGPYVSGLSPVVTSSARTTDETALVAQLESRGVHDAVADYWSAYRLTFLARERVRVVPLHEAQDRVPEYRARFAKARRVAYVNDELRSFEDRAATERELLASGQFTPYVERFDSGVFHVVVLTRREP